MLKQTVVSMRPWQWYKNLVIFVGIVFSLNVFDVGMWKGSLLAFIAFCFVSGANYIFNDIIDRRKDKLHPRKCLRPIASGELGVGHALLLGGVLLILGVIVSYFVNMSFLFVLLGYVVLVLLYSFYLKKVIIADVITISLGFVIRAVAGCVAISVIISPWLIVCAFLLAMFLALGKRRGELEALGEGEHRKSLSGYSVGVLDNFLSITTAVLITSYSLYTFMAGNIYLLLTLPFPVYCLFRYLLLVREKSFGEEPELLFKDRGILMGIVFWFLTVVIVLFV
jgi:4-hydroxybenzoate polyprenyltransferase